MEIIINGVISGIVLAFLIGPVFFTIIQTSIEKGFVSGVFVAIGVSLSDSVYILVSYLGLVQFMEAESFRHYMAYTGGLILLGFGLYYLLVKRRKLAQFQFEVSNVEGGPWLKLIGKGVLINALSPMVLFFWVATVGVATTRLGYAHPGKATLFFISIVSTVFLTDVIKAKLADKLRTLITPRFIRIMNIVLGIVMIVFAGRLILFPDDIN
ncbi:MAG TPA: LysE family transporter [Chryseolinea sp.]|nr:LysE family transporter [Chryseolinea sp.]